ncbi:MAG: arsenite methyltransferase [Candidatus Sumerlaeota bacterium]|nr:arsenite methyltransferase [Candidatus Sumerlaeota bacterium]
MNEMTSEHQPGEEETTRAAVRERYGRIAQREGSCCASSSCCGVGAADQAAVAMGYDAADLATLPAGANMGLSCGNPLALASLKPGEVVLDLGSGGGFDVFLAGQKVGPTGRAIGVDMTPEMLAKARRNIAAYRERTGWDNVEFRLGEIEHLPVADSGVDVIISNCVINLSPDKPAVFREAFRILRSGGRLAISDVVATAPLPESMRSDKGLVCGCIGGAATIDELRGWLEEIGFERIRIEPREESRLMVSQWAPGSGAEQYVVSAWIEAIRPARLCWCG